MKKIFIILISLNLVLAFFGAICSPVVAKSRRNLIEDFILSCKALDYGFTNSDNYNFTTPEATYYALEMLDGLDLLEDQIEFDTFIDELIEDIQSEINDLDDISLETLYYLILSINLLDGLDEVSSEDKNTIIDWINQSRNENGGFGNNNNDYPTVFHTYYSVKIISLLSSENISDAQDHTNWIISCYNNIDGGFGGNSTLTSNIISTYFSVLGINFLTNISDLASQNNTIIDYIIGFYNSNPYDSQNYGGFTQTTDPSKALISTTYFCVSTVYYLDSSRLNSQTILQWLLQFQNPSDGGFTESTGNSIYSYSSITTTYYAYKIIQYFDPELSLLNENVWDVEFNWIISLIIILVIIFVPIIAVVIIWYRRKL